MQSLGRNGYTAEEVVAVLHGPSRTWDFSYELLDEFNKHKSWLTNVADGSVKHSTIEEIRRSAFFRVRDTDEVDWYKDRIKPWVKLRMPDGGWVSWPQGIFLLTSPTRKVSNSGAVWRDVSGLDQTVVLRDFSSADRYTVLAGTNYATAVRSLLAGAGISRMNVEPTTLTLPTDREWDPGTSRLEIVNDLLQAMAYEPITFDSEGVAVARAYVLPELRPSTYTYADDTASVTMTEAEQSFDLENVPNQWTLVVSEPDRPPLRSQWVNDNPASPTSVPSRGRIIAVFDDSVDAADQDTLDLITQRRAYDDTQGHLEVEFSTGLMPFHDDEDVLRLDLSRLGATMNYVESMWSMNLAAGAAMEHRAVRVINLDPTNVPPEA